MSSEVTSVNKRSLVRQRYHDPIYDDQTVEGLMRYFKFESYSQLCDYLKSIKKR